MLGGVDLGRVVTDEETGDKFVRYMPFFDEELEDGSSVRELIGTSPEILRWVREGRCDAGLCMLPQAHPGLLLRPLSPLKCIGATGRKSSA